MGVFLPDSVSVSGLGGRQPIRHAQYVSPDRNGSGGSGERRLVAAVPAERRQFADGRSADVLLLLDDGIYSPGRIYGLQRCGAFPQAAGGSAKDPEGRPHWSICGDFIVLYAAAVFRKHDDFSGKFFSCKSGYAVRDVHHIAGAFGIQRDQSEADAHQSVSQSVVPLL